MSSDLIVIKAKIKEVTGGYSVSSDFVDVLNEKVKKLIEEAIIRAEANGRRTVMGRDI
ncbi:DUF1931 domain-containing protein [Candidatus Woesearchaeota archaeon]|nr:DUF1931 domain-containing protein [Candidatus Woesearchaeota archaeon]